MEALDLFIEAYGAEAGNLALRSVATGGLFIGGMFALAIISMAIPDLLMRACE